VKLDTSSPALYAAIMAMLLGARLWRAVAKRRTAPPAARPVRVAPQV
jgi:DMSO/TMAO reductase YedYZ heme-binding membrane subunit